MKPSCVHAHNAHGPLIAVFFILYPRSMSAPSQVLLIIFREYFPYDQPIYGFAGCRNAIRIEVIKFLILLMND